MNTAVRGVGHLSAALTEVDRGHDVCLIIAELLVFEQIVHQRASEHQSISIVSDVIADCMCKPEDING